MRIFCFFICFFLTFGMYFTACGEHLPKDEDIKLLDYIEQRLETFLERVGQEKREDVLQTIKKYQETLTNNNSQKNTGYILKEIEIRLQGNKILQGAMQEKFDILPQVYTSRREFFPLPLEYFIDYSNLSLAGEKVPLGEKYFDNKTRLEKEVMITQYNFYQLILYHKRMPLYFPFIEKRLREKKLPDDLKYLAVAESALRIGALSHASAGGIWQFIPDTGRRYGLKINEFVDERYHFEKSTNAALDYLEKLYGDFGSWSLAMAAYNRGEAGLQRDLASQEVRSFYDLWLNSETYRYVFRIVAIKYVLENRDKIYGKNAFGEPYALPATLSYEVAEILDLQNFASQHGHTYRDIKSLNPWIVGDMLPLQESGEKYEILFFKSKFIP